MPDQYGTSLYLRPFLFGTDADLALHGISHATFMVIACVVGSYYKSGLAPVDMLIEMDDVRAVRGGTGYANAAATTQRQPEQAKRRQRRAILRLYGLTALKEICRRRRRHEPDVRLGRQAGDT